MEGELFMGKILDTTYHDSVEKITQFNEVLIKNSFYTINDKKPTIVTYYNINKNERRGHGVQKACR